jgi:uncharacterized protein
MLGAMSSDRPGTDLQPPGPDPSRGTALVTGATAGIGREFARQLAGRRHGLVLVARDRIRLEELARELTREHGVDVEVMAADLADREELLRVEQRLADPRRPVELLVNNAGFGLRKRFADNSVEDEQRLLDVLVVAVMRLTHAALGSMVARGHGAVVNVSSLAGFLPRGTYGAAKTWVTRFSVWADAEYSPRGVRVMALCPGFVRTEFHARMDVDRRSAPRVLWLEPDAVVREALADLDAGKSLSVPSRRYRVLTTAMRVVPFRVLHRFQKVGRR